MTPNFPTMGTRMLVLVLFCIAQVSAQFPDYNYRKHPLHTLSAFSTFSTRPVVMKRYYFHESRGKYVTNDAVFAPGGASYNDFNSGASIFEGADVLYTPSLDMDSSNERGFVEVHLNSRARIFVLLDPQDFRLSEAAGVQSVIGAPQDWEFVSVVQRVGDGKLMDERRHALSPKPAILPELAVVMEIPRSRSRFHIFPHPRTMNVGNDFVKQMHIVMVPFGEGEFPVSGFPKPQLPSTFQSLLNPGEQIDPSRDPVIPNTDCPQWLHDLYVTEDYDSNQKFWRTWHPSIDLVYWCYFEHEHGSFPGNYRPQFHYTPSRTPDETSPTGFQLESHGGFKVFSFVVPSDGRVVTVVMHMHLSLARRFYARFHTVIFAVHRVIRRKKWEKEMELSMKMDFGLAKAQLSGTKYEAPFNSEGEAIEAELSARKREAFRKFNVLNIDENFPDSLDTRYEIRGNIADGPEAVRIGNYEKWRGPLNTCTRMYSGRVNIGMTMDVRDPQTAIRSVDRTDNDNIQELRGRGGRRFIIMNKGQFLLSTSFCEFNGTNKLEDRGSDGVFYTDPKFSQILSKSDNVGYVRQYIKHGFQDLDADPGMLSTSDGWLASLTAHAPGKRDSIPYPEGSVIKMKN